MDELFAEIDALVTETETLVGLGNKRTAEQTNRLKAIPALIDGKTEEIEAIKKANAAVKAVKDRRNTPDPSSAPHPSKPAVKAKGSDGSSESGEMSIEQQADALYFGGSIEPIHRVKSVGDLFVESDEWLAAQETLSGAGAVRIKITGPRAKAINRAIKAVMTSADYVPPTTRIGVVSEIPLRPISLLSIIPAQTDGPPVIEFMKQTVRENKAATVKEGALKPQGRRVFEPVKLTPEIIAETQPVTEQQLKYSPQVKSVIDRQLMDEVRLELENQCLNGAGNSPNLAGILTRDGLLKHTKGGDTLADAVVKAQNKLITTSFLRPTHTVIHPDDMLAVWTAKDTTGAYLMGHPWLRRDVQFQVPPIESLLIPAGSPLTGDFSKCELWYPESDTITIVIGWMNDDFGRNQRTIRAEIAACIATYREDAFCQIV